MKIVLLMLALSPSDIDVETAFPFMSFDQIEDCRDIATHINATTESYAYCLAAEG